MHEASNASKLREDLKDVKGFYVPEIYWQFSSQKILVLEWLDGIAFSNSKAIQDSNFDKKQIAENLVISYFNQVYVHGFFHADMHPGNLFLLKNGDIGVVDFGIMGKIDKKTRLGIAEILIGFLNRDYKRVAQLHIDIGLVPSNTKVDDLALSCRRIGETIVGSDVKDIPVAKLLGGLIAMTRDYKMDTRPELLLLQKTVLLVEGVGVSLDPNLNIWNLARPWIKNWAQKNIGFDAKIRDAMLDLFEMAKKFVRSF
jgi:ubiquinone biosynthesis protein